MYCRKILDKEVNKKTETKMTQNILCAPSYIAAQVHS